MRSVFCKITSVALWKVNWKQGETGEFMRIWNTVVNKRMEDQRQIIEDQNGQVIENKEIQEKREFRIMSWCLESSGEGHWVLHGWALKETSAWASGKGFLSHRRRRHAEHNPFLWPRVAPVFPGAVAAMLYQAGLQLRVKALCPGGAAKGWGTWAPETSQDFWTSLDSSCSCSGRHQMSLFLRLFMVGFVLSSRGILTGSRAHSWVRAFLGERFRVTALLHSHMKIHGLLTSLSRTQSHCFYGSIKSTSWCGFQECTALRKWKLPVTTIDS